MFLFTEYATDSKYGFDADYPINIGIIRDRSEQQFYSYFFKDYKDQMEKKLNLKK